MNAQDLSSLIRSEVLADEPEFLASSAPAIAAGRRVVRRRRVTLAAGTTAAVVALGFGVVGLRSPSDVRPAEDPIPPAAQEVLDSFDPATFPGIVDAEIRGVAGDAIPASVEPRIEPVLDGYMRLRPEDYAYTDSWSADYVLSPTDELLVLLRHDQSANEGSAERYCEENLALGEMETCTVDVLADGSVTITSVSEIRRKANGDFTLPGGDPDTRWYQRQVVHRRDYGFGVIAREQVKAETLARADEAWSLSTDQLAAIATSPRLVYEMPDAEKECESPTFVSGGHDGFARVICDESVLN